MVDYTSVTGVLDLPVSDRVHELVYVNQPERWHIPTPKAVHGQTDGNSDAVYSAFQQPRWAKDHGVYIAVIKDAIVSPSGLVFADGKVVYESAFPWQMSNIEQRYGSEIEQYRAHISGERPLSLGQQDAVFQAREGGESGYFHFINSIIPRIALYSRIARPALPLLIFDEPRFTNQLLKALEIETILRPSVWLSVKDFYFPSPMTFEGDHFQRARAGSALIRSIVDKIMPKSTVSGRRLYLSRNDSAVRRLINEDQILDLVTSMGFEVQAVGDMALVDQARLFGECDYLISPHGAGLSNMAFMPEGSNIIEIVSPSRLWPTFRTLAARMNMTYGAAIGSAIESTQTAEKGVGNEDFFCDAEILKRVLVETMGRD